MVNKIEQIEGRRIVSIHTIGSIYAHDDVLLFLDDGRIVKMNVNKFLPFFEDKMVEMQKAISLTHVINIKTIGKK